MSELYVALFHARDREQMDYPKTVDEFHKAAKAHADQANFTSTARNKGKWLKPTVNVSPEEGSGFTFSGDVTAEQIESGILEAGQNVEPRLTGKAGQKKDKEKQHLIQENQQLRQELSDLKSQIDEMKEMIQQQAEKASSDDEDSSTTDRAKDLFEEAALDEPEL